MKNHHSFFLLQLIVFLFPFLLALHHFRNSSSTKKRNSKCYEKKLAQSISATVLITKHVLSMYKSICGMGVNIFAL